MSRSVEPRSESVDPNLDITVDFREGEWSGAKPSSAPTSLGKGFQLGRYQIVGPLGSGGMGAVYKALDAKTRQFVALKIVDRKQDHATETDRFQIEAETLSRLNHQHHPHIVPFYESGEAGDFLYISMRLLEGGPLRQQTEHFRENPREAVRLLLKVADAVAYAHDLGILHLDLKPANIILDLEGNPYVVDFGAARAWDSRAGETIAPTFMGTPVYIAPEQIAGADRIGPATDVYGLGATLYEMLTGRPPFDGAGKLSLQEILQSRQTLTPPQAVNPKVPAALDGIVRKCMEKDPRNRYSTVRELQQDLQQFLVGEPIAGIRLGWRRRLGLFWERVSGLVAFSWRPQPEQSLGLLTPILQCVSDGVVVVDASGLFVAANAVAIRILDEDPVGQHLESWLKRMGWHPAGQDSDSHGRDFPLVRAQHGEHVAETDIFVTTSTRPRGAWLRLTARPLPSRGKGGAGAVAVFRDVSDLNTLDDDEAQHQSLWDGLRLNVFRKDLDGRYSFVNNVLCTTLGQPRDQILGRSDFDFFRHNEAEIYRSSDRQVIESGQVVERIEEHRSGACAPICRCRSPEPGGGQTAKDAQAEPADDRRYVQSLLAPVYDSAGQVIGTQGIFWNITAQRRAERQLANLADELRQSNAELARSNSDLEQFAYAASHDLQEPLRMVASFTKLLKDRYTGRLDADADEFIGFAIDGATRMQALINDLLTYSRVNKPGQPLDADVDCGQVVADAVANLQAAIFESDAVVTCGQLPKVRGDHGQLVMLLQNLIGNAIKFRKEQPPRVHIDCEPSERGWQFSVEDNGIGIDPKHAGRIFTIFQRLHARGKYPGTGIGLALCKRIVDRHGGRIWVEPRTQGGSVFYFTLADKTEREKRHE